MDTGCPLTISLGDGSEPCEVRSLDGGWCEVRRRKAWQQSYGVCRVSNLRRAATRPNLSGYDPMGPHSSNIRTPLMRRSSLDFEKAVALSILSDERNKTSHPTRVESKRSLLERTPAGTPLENSNTLSTVSSGV